MAGMYRSIMIALAGLLLLLAGCTITPHKPAEIHEPIDAFNAAAQPHTRSESNYRGDLSTSVQRLQRAHWLYERSQARQRQEVEQSQAQCRQQSGSRQVPIQDAAGKFVYCQPAQDAASTNQD